VDQVIDPVILEEIREPDEYIIDDSQICHFNGNSKLKLAWGPNIKPMPLKCELEDIISAKVILKAGDGITTDDIIPPSAEVLALRSNIPALSEHLFEKLDKDFVKRAKSCAGSAILGGENYGQGSSREHAAIAPMYLGTKIVLTKSIARIHRSNLINFGILPLIFENAEDYQRIEQDDELELVNVHEQLAKKRIIIKNKTKGFSFPTKIELSEHEYHILLAGGLLAYIKGKNKQ
jgi:aconitate hydratase